MIFFLRVLYGLVLATMVVVTVSSSLQENILKIPSAVTSDPWFIATLFDAYFGFLFFFLWVCYKEKALWIKLSWFVAIALLGNIAMAVYMLLKLFRLPAGSSALDLMLNEQDRAEAASRRRSN